jgi:DNA-binding NtrC family response regulator
MKTTKELNDAVDIPICMSVQEIDKELIMKALYENDGRIKMAANQLGISTQTLRKKRKAYGIC